MNPHDARQVHRRQVFGGVAAAGLGAPLLVACGQDEGGASSGGGGSADDAASDGGSSGAATCRWPTCPRAAE